MATATYIYDTATDKDVDPEGVAEFFDCVGAGRHTGVVTTLALYPGAIRWRRADAEAPDCSADALHLACQAGQRHIAEILLDAGAEVDSLNWGENKTTTLQSAAAQGWDEGLVALLLERGADPDGTAHKGFAPLTFAACAGRAAIAGMLLKKGANPDIQGEDGTPPLFQAAVNGDRDMIRLLLQYGARTDVRNERGEDVIEAARTLAGEDTIAFLAKAALDGSRLLTQQFDAAIADMGRGTQAPLKLKKPLRLKAGP